MGLTRVVQNRIDNWRAPPWLFKGVYISGIAVSLAHSAFVIGLIANLDDVRAGSYLQIFSLFPVLSTCAFMLQSVPIAFQSKFHPQMCNYAMFRALAAVLSLSHSWFSFAWIYISMQHFPRMNSTPMAIAALSMLTSVNYALLTIVRPEMSHTHHQPLLSIPANNADDCIAPAPHIRLTKLIGWVAVAFLAFSSITLVSVNVPGTWTLLLAGICAVGSATIALARPCAWQIQLAIAATFHFACFYVKFCSERQRDVFQFSLQQAALLTLSVTFIALGLFGKFSETRRDPSVVEIIYRANATAKFSIGDTLEDDGLLDTN